MYRFILWLVPTVDKFPRSQKFLLGDRIQSTALDVLERLIEATYPRARGPMLAAALGIEKLRLLFRGSGRALVHSAQRPTFCSLHGSLTCGITSIVRILRRPSSA
jgi:hypothetical protein